MATKHVAQIRITNQSVSDQNSIFVLYYAILMLMMGNKIQINFNVSLQVAVVETSSYHYD